RRAAAEAELLADLTAEYQRLGDWLDLRAEQAARMLNHGPNPADITALWAAGALPPHAHELWPHLELTKIPLLRLPHELRESPDDRRGMADLTHDELLELWHNHAFEPARELLAEQITDHYENRVALHELNLSLNLAYIA